MNILYVSAYKVDKQFKDGISKKIKNQINAFESIGYNVDYIYRVDGGIEAKIDGHIFFKKLSTFSFYFLFLFKVFSLINKKYDYLYLRNIGYETNVILLLSFFRKAKLITKRLILEIPAFPFGGEINNLKQKITMVYYNNIKKYFYKYVDLIVFMGEDQKKIWRIPALRIVNCVNLRDILVVESKKIDKDINILGIANLQKWHGFDRIITGIYDYKSKKMKSKNIVFHIVGDNQPELDNLKKLTKTLGVESNVEFHGRLNSEEINKLITKMHIGVDSVGRHRSGIAYNCSIKSKEYTAMNLPFIKSHKDDSFENVDFVKNVPANEEPIDIDDLISWRLGLNDFSTDIHDYAVKNFIWESQFKKIFVFFENKV